MINEGRELRVSFDNFDFRILTNIIINGYQNSDMHWTCQYITFNRVSSDQLDNTRPLVQDITKFDNTEYLLSDEKQKKMKNEYVILVARILVEFFSCLKSLKSVIPKHIQHDYSKEMPKNPPSLVCQWSPLIRTRPQMFPSIFRTSQSSWLKLTVNKSRCPLKMLVQWRNLNMHQRSSKIKISLWLVIC